MVTGPNHGPFHTFDPNIAGQKPDQASNGAPSWWGNWGAQPLFSFLPSGVPRKNSSMKPQIERERDMSFTISTRTKTRSGLKRRPLLVGELGGAASLQLLSLRRAPEKLQVSFSLSTRTKTRSGLKWRPLLVGELGCAASLQLLSLRRAPEKLQVSFTISTRTKTRSGLKGRPLLVGELGGAASLQLPPLRRAPEKLQYETTERETYETTQRQRERSKFQPFYSDRNKSGVRGRPLLVGELGGAASLQLPPLRRAPEKLQVGREHVLVHDFDAAEHVQLGVLGVALGVHGRPGLDVQGVLLLQELFQPSSPAWLRPLAVHNGPSAPRKRPTSHPITLMRKRENTRKFRAEADKTAARK
ncbi:unnamed protein product [Menidia menidia]|uniref:(Atlantic silverside) hypothetical protein n=1 Tax=Menidia menidia TaxID=238744 RepID=A0A8S4ARG1_9TELE|nr:unnamed protein product [Menidia menidia]